MTVNKELVVSLMTKNPKITLGEISERLSISERQVKRLVSDLTSLGIITRKGSNRAGEWIIVQK